MWGFFKNMLKPFSHIGEKIVLGLGSIGTKIGHWVRGGEAVAKVGREPIIAGGRAVGGSWTPIQNIGQSILTNGWIDKVNPYLRTRMPY